MSTPPLFIYDDLMLGQREDGLLAAREREPATVRGWLHRLASGAAALELDPQGRTIKGELITDTDEGMLKVIDIVRGMQTLGFVQTPVRVGTRRGQREAVAYVMDTRTLRANRARRLRTDTWRGLGPR